MGKRWRSLLVLPGVALVAAIATGASNGARGFGIVDEPLYAVNSIAIASSLVDGGTADLDTTSSSHPPFGSALLSLGLLGPPIFPEPIKVDATDGEALCALSVPLGAARPALVTAKETHLGWEVALNGMRAAVPSRPTACVDLIDRVALLMVDGSVVFVQPVQQREEVVLVRSGAIFDPSGRWIEIVSSAPEPGGALLARSVTGIWWRIGDPVAEREIVPTSFSGELLIGVGVVGYLDGSSANLTQEASRQVLRLFDVCADDSCGTAEAQLRSGRLLLNGDVEQASRGDLLESLRNIGGITYGQTRIAIGVDGDKMVLVDLDFGDQILARLPFSATRLHAVISGGGREGWDATLATKTRLTAMNVRVFPSPTFTITDETRFDQILGLSPAGGSSLATVFVRDEDGQTRLVLVERRRLRSVTGRVLTGDIQLSDDGATSMYGGRASVALYQSAGENYLVDTGAAADRLRLSSQAAFVVSAVAAAAIGVMVSPVAALFAGGVFLSVSVAWEQARVAMLDAWLAALLAWSVVSGIIAVRQPVRTRRNWRRFAALGAAGVFVGAAAGVKLSAFAIGLPLVAAVAAARTIRGAARAVRVSIAIVGALGVVVGIVGVIAGSGFGGTLNIAASVSLLFVSRIWSLSSDSEQRSMKNVATDLILAAGAAGIVALACLALPSFIGATVGGETLDTGGSIMRWLQAALDVVEGFTLDHPLGLPFWGLAMGLGLGYSLSASPSLLMAVWTGVRLRVKERAKGTDELISLLFTIALLSIAVWAPLSRILFPWYAVSLAVPAAAAVGIALATRSRHWYPVALAAAIAPAISWLAGPTVCLASLARLDRGCQVITTTDIVGTAVLAGSCTVLAIMAVRIEKRAIRIFGGRGRAAIAQFALVFGGTVVALAASTLMGRIALEGYGVVVAMEVLWAISLGVIVLAWTRGRHRVAALIAATLIGLELLRSVGLATGLRAWQLVPTQVGRVIPSPLLHPVPMAIMGVVTGLLIVGAIVALRRRAAAAP